MWGVEIFDEVCLYFGSKIKMEFIMPKKQNEVVGEKLVVAINGEALRDKIYTIRGRRVMLDYDLAEIYGYETKAFNRQVRNNIEKFEGEEFMFQLTWEELDDFLRCKNCTLKNDSIGGEMILRSQNVTLKNKQGEHFKYLPYAFTEQGIYMLMTVLRGPLAVRQSRALVMLFKSMKDYILENRALLEQREQLKMITAVLENTKKVTEIEGEVVSIDKRLASVEEQIGKTVMRSEISPVLLDFNKAEERKEYIFLNGQPMRASELYMDIYAKAKRNIYIIDDYVSIKTLRQLQSVKSSVKVVIFSDNKGSYLHKSDYVDFARECPGVKVEFARTEGLIHDRFIVIDYGEEGEAIYHCGASAKDAGSKVAAVGKFEDELVKAAMGEVIERLKRNRKLVLR